MFLCFLGLAAGRAYIIIIWFRHIKSVDITFLDDYASPHHHQLVRVTQIDNDFQKRLYPTNAYVAAHKSNIISMVLIIVRSKTYIITRITQSGAYEWLESMKNRDNISKILVFFLARSNQNISNQAWI